MKFEVAEVLLSLGFALTIRVSSFVLMCTLLLGLGVGVGIGVGVRTVVFRSDRGWGVCVKLDTRGLEPTSPR